MKSLIIKICLPILILACSSGAFASGKTDPEVAKVRMAGEITKGSDEVFNCSMGMTSDKEIVGCIESVLEKSIQNDRDTAEFLMGAYFTGFARLTGSSPAEKMKDKWLATCFNRFSEIQKYLGFTDKELAEITGNTAVLPEIAKMRLKTGK